MHSDAHRRRILKGGDYWFSSPIYHDGLIYAVNGNRNFSVVDAKTGKVVYADRLDFEGRVYPSICLAGKYIYVSSDNGTTIVLENRAVPTRRSPATHWKRSGARRYSGDGACTSVRSSTCGASVSDERQPQVTTSRPSC